MPRPAPESPLSDARQSLADALRGRYDLVREVGRGGAATVYEARDLRHDRTVALKVLRDRVAERVGVERFRREVRLAARLQHPHILGVLDSDESDGRCWFTMPFVRGETLENRLRREQRLPVDEALRILRMVGRALAYAHTAGVLHRDLKPENILLAEDGHALLADFGIACAIDEARLSGTGADRTERRLTRPGFVIGTPGYMAPEQSTAGPLDERADQYALAVVAWEMLAGSLPFVNAEATLVEQVPQLRPLRAEVPADVEAAIRRALAVRPGDRFASVSAFVTAATAMLDRPPAPAPVPRRRARPLLAAGGLALAAAATFTLWRLRPPPPAAPPGPARLVVLPFENLGDTADAYVADGVADVIRTKLLALPGIEVIARNSSVPYGARGTPPETIARELNVRYLLTGTVKLDRAAGRVVLQPELMEVGATGGATQRWSDVMEQPLAGVGAMQAEIAGRVAERLRGTLAGTDLGRLREVPTTDPAAYDAYLRGIAILSSAPGELRRKADLMRTAVQRDPAFVEAWSELAIAASFLRANSYLDPRAADDAAEAAAAVERLAPDRAIRHVTRGVYWWAARADAVRAQAEFEQARRLAPHDATILARLAQTDVEQGRYADGLALYREAVALDPRSAAAWYALAHSLFLLRRYPEALDAARRAQTLSPTTELEVLRVVSIQVAMGDLAGARATIAEAERRIPADDLRGFLATYEDYAWVFTGAEQEAILAFPVARFYDDVSTRAIVQAQLRHARGDRAGARAWGDSAAASFAKDLRAATVTRQLHYLRAIALAYAGRAAEAEAELARGSARTDGPAYDRAYNEELEARALALLGRRDEAIARLTRILAAPGTLSAGRLRLDPVWVTLRDDPRVAALLAPRTP